MRRRVPTLVTALVLSLFCLTDLRGQRTGLVGRKVTAPAVEDGGVAVFFSPDGRCTAAIVEQIGQARTTLDVQAYSFTSAPIAKAVADAHGRGVKVRVVLDKSQRGERYTSATFLKNQGVPVWIDDRHAIAHNKVMLIDGQVLITGSFNFSKSAEESNAENLLIIQDRPKLIEAYVRNFEQHLAHSDVYAGPAAGGEPAGTRQTNQRAADGPAASPARVPAGEGGVVHATNSGTKYHAAGCRMLAKSDVPMSLSEAKRKGLTPCGVCKPIQ